MFVNHMQPRPTAGKPSKPRGNQKRLSVAKIAAPLTVLVSLLVILAFGVASASAATAWWHLDAVAVPANLPPGGSGTIVVSASNLGDAAVSGSKAPVKLTDKRPASKRRRRRIQRGSLGPCLASTVRALSRRPKKWNASLKANCWNMKSLKR